jgi:hypothetical protein
MKIVKPAMVIGASLVALALANAQDAHADEASYLNGVGDYGVEVNAGTLPLGHQVCSDISDNGVDGVDTEAKKAVVAGVSPHNAAVIIVLAVSELCPSNEPALKAWMSSTTTAA